MVISTPRMLSEGVREFCRELVPNGKPVWVKVRPERSSDPGECFFNVDRKVKAVGGSAVFGWCIWTWEGILIEAEHHCIHLTKVGKLVDITPTNDRERKILFVADPEAPFDFVNFVRRNNVRKALRNDPDISEFIAIADQIHALRQKHSIGREVRIPAQEYQLLRRTQEIHANRISQKYHK
jgi:hypothetical protein